MVWYRRGGKREKKRISYIGKNAGNKDDTWSMDTVENTVELPFTYRTMVSNTFRPPPPPPLPPFLKAISTVPSLPSLVPACGWLIDMETGRQGIRTRIPPSRINGSYPPHPSYPDPPKDRSRRRFPDNLKSSPPPSPLPVINYASFKSWFRSVHEITRRLRACMRACCDGNGA